MGRAIHSNEYRDSAAFRDQNVVVVGAGESASDIALQISQVAKQCIISTRSAPGTLFPRSIQGNTPDIRDDRLTYNLSRKFSRAILIGQRRFYYSQRDDKDLFRWAANSNFLNNRCPFNTNACKSFGIPEAIKRHNALAKSAIKSVDEKRVIFEDGSDVACDSIIFCTGYKLNFSFLDDELSRMLIPVNNLWKNCVHPVLGDRLFLVGFSRPQQINLVSICEMQARVAAMIISRKRPLPRKEMLLNSIEVDKNWMNTYYSDRYRKNPALVDYLYYMEGLAKFVGCTVPFVQALLRDPRLWLKLIFASLNGAHYRLIGPGSNWTEAAGVIKLTPQFSDWRNAIFRWTVLTVLTSLGLAVGIVNPDYRSIHRQSRY